VIFAFLVVNGLYSVDNNSVPDVASSFALPETENTPAQSPASPQQNAQNLLFIERTNNNPEKSVEKDQRAVKIPLPNIELAANTRNPKIPQQRTENNNNNGSSKESALTSPNILTPKGVGSNSNSTAVKDFLTFFEIDASFSNNQWQVKSVGEKALNSGLKVNDIIEAIDGKKLAGEIVNGTNFNGILTILRGAERIEINLQNK
jgi:hypothetical protein